MKVGLGLSLSRSRRLSGGAGAWSPADLPGLAAWYTAGPTWCFTDAGATTPCGDGDPIYTWTDRSGNGYTLTQATLAYRPILYSLGGGLWVATFDGVDDFFGRTFALTQPYTRFAAWDHRSPQDNTAAIFDSAPMAANYLNFASAGTLRMYAGLSGPQRAGLSNGVRYRTVEVFDGAASRLYVDGSESTGDAGGDDPGGVTVGAVAGGTYCADFDLYELGLAAGAVSADDAARLDEYLTLPA